MITPVTTMPVKNRCYRGVLRQVEARFRALFADLNRAHQAFARLAHLAEDMRILSLNAELAAGRAGSRGVAVRALTQYTRGLVARLMQINQSATGLKSLYGMSTGALRSLHYLWLIESASSQLGAALLGGSGQNAADTLDRVRHRYVDAIGTDLDGIVKSVALVYGMVGVVDEVVAQAASIATNIATEAAGAGLHAGEFMAVADNMRRYVETLQAMNDQAAKVMRGACQDSRMLRDVASMLLR